MGYCIVCAQVHYAESARIYVTASKDGDVKTWDGVSNRCINTFQRAHDGAEVCSSVFTRNGKVIRIESKVIYYFRFV